MKITLENTTARFKEKFKTSKEFTEKSKEIIPGGYSRASFNYGPHAIFVDRGEGQYIHTMN